MKIQVRKARKTAPGSDEAIQYRRTLDNVMTFIKFKEAVGMPARTMYLLLRNPSMSNVTGIRGKSAGSLIGGNLSSVALPGAAAARQESCRNGHVSVATL